jgi:hypothetical protein
MEEKKKDNGGKKKLETRKFETGQKKYFFLRQQFATDFHETYPNKHFQHHRSPQ